MSATTSSEDLATRSIHDHRAVRAYDQLVTSHRESRVRRALRIEKLKEKAEEE